jgi:hypothetical protein
LRPSRPRPPPVAYEEEEFRRSQADEFDEEPVTSGRAQTPTSGAQESAVRQDVDEDGPPDRSTAEEEEEEVEG